jgi:hypothetical protein
MRRKALLFAALVAAVLAVAAVPAAANNKPVSGPRLPFAAFPTTFAANSPFHIEQGFGCLLRDTPCVTSQITGQSTFQLYLDGVLQPSTTDVDVDATNGIIRKFQLTNYPNGLLTGTHTFVGVFIIDGVVVQTSTVTADFV